MFSESDNTVAAATADITNFQQHITEINPEFASLDQHDAAEFILSILNRISEVAPEALFPVLQVTPHLNMVHLVTDFQAGKESYSLQDFESDVRFVCNEPEFVFLTFNRIYFDRERVTYAKNKAPFQIPLCGLRLSDMENFAYQIESSKAAWLELQQTKQEIDKAFDAAVVEMNNTP